MSPRAGSLAIAACVFLVDRVTKQLIESRVSAWDTYVVIPGFFNIVHTRNRGIVFGIMNDGSSELRAFFLIGLAMVVMVFVGALLWQAGKSGTWLLRTSLALVLGGAAGNLYDRVFIGSVTDFLEFYAGSYVWPSFNVADSAITIGAILMLVEMLQSRRKQPART